MIQYQAENCGKRRDFRSNPHKNWVVPPHMHEYTEIAYTTEGVTTVIVSGKRYLLPKDHVIFILPNRVHEYTDETESEMRCAVFSNDHIPFFFELLGRRVPRDPVLDLSGDPSLLRALAATDHGDTLRLSGLLSLLSDALLRSTELIPAPSGAPASILYAAIEYVSENFRRDIHLSDVAKT